MTGPANSSFANTTLLQSGTPLPNGDQEIISQDTSIMRRGNQSVISSGAAWNLIGGDLIMDYWCHNSALDVNGNFLPRDDPGACTFICLTEGTFGAGYMYWLRFDAVPGTGIPAFLMTDAKGPGCFQTVNNNAASSITLNTLPTPATFLSCTGTQAASVQFIFPPVAGIGTGYQITVYSQAAVGTAATWTSTGGTFLSAPATLAAGSVTRFTLNGTVWTPS